MRSVTSYLIATGLCLTASVNAATVSFLSDPFAGSDALTTPGRQVVGGEPSINFNIATDVFVFNPDVFGFGNQVLFANDVVGNLPTSDVNVIVLQTLDNDADPTTPFGAGTAANLIAGQVSAPTPGLFIYFNSGLDLPRLVFSTNLSDDTADLKILARMTNFAGQPGIMPSFTEANFAPVPEPSSMALMAVGAALIGVGARRKLQKKEQ